MIRTCIHVTHSPEANRPPTTNTIKAKRQATIPAALPSAVRGPRNRVARPQDLTDGRRAVEVPVPIRGDDLVTADKVEYWGWAEDATTADDDDIAHLVRPIPVRPADTSAVR